MRQTNRLVTHHPNIGLHFLPPKRALACLLAIGWMSGISSAAEKPPLPRAPEGFILDEARALPEDVQAALSAEIGQFRASTGCNLWVITSTYQSGTSLRDHANELVHAWIPSGEGIVLAYDRASDSHAMSPTDSMWRKYPTPTLVEAFRETGALIQDKKPALEKRLTGSIRLLMTRITEAEQLRVRQNQLLPGHDLWAAIAFLVLLICGTSCCAFIIAALRKRDAANAIRYFFPQAEGAMRFGAPYGGGVIAEARISPPHP